MPPVAKEKAPGGNPTPQSTTPKSQIATLTLAESADAVKPLSWAAISQEPQTTALLALFQRYSRVGQCAFSTMGKLYRHMQRGLAPGQEMYPVLAAVGVPKGTISSASYASKVFALVEQGILPESTYDTFTFAAVVAIRRVMSSQSRRVLTAQEVVRAIRKQPETWEADFESLYRCGLTLAERRASELAPDPAPTKTAHTLPSMRPTGRQFAQGESSPPIPFDAGPITFHLEDDPRDSFRKLLGLAHDSVIEARSALAHIRRDSPADRLISDCLGCIGRLRLALNEGAL